MSAPINHCMISARVLDYYLDISWHTLLSYLYSFNAKNLILAIREK